AAAVMAITILLLVGVDQLTKYLVLQHLVPGDPMVVIPHVLQFRYLQNTGAAFSMLSGKTLALTILTSVILVVLLVFLFRDKFSSKLAKTGAILIFAGGCGNLIDRVFRHYVVDFMEFLFTDFAVFNFADWCVTIGAALLIIALFVDMGQDSRKAKQER
ncbi:MAG: signal peptidase II, partial [Clostridia bacterium]|nr:signal peptidase II [Clostridia bacterium]